MDFVEILPPEVVEEIFQHLTSKDILNCSLVSLKWREVLNSNRVWNRICNIEGLHEREFLLYEKSYFSNPLRRFRPIKNVASRLSDMCYWRCHYDQYKYLESNWRRGRFAVHQLETVFSSWPTYYNEGLLVVQVDTYFIIYNIRGESCVLTRLPFKYPQLSIETVIVLKDFLIFSQGNHIIGVKLTSNSYSEAFNLTVNSCDNQSVVDSSHLRIVTCGQYMIYHSSLSSTKLFIYNLKVNSLEREIDLDHSKLDHIQCNCLDANNQRVYLSITRLSSQTVHAIVAYNLAKGNLCVELPVQERIDKFYFADGVIAGQASQNHSEDSYTLYLWTAIEGGHLLTKIPVNGKQPIIITKEVIFHCQNSTVIMTLIENLTDRLSVLESMFDSQFIVRADTIVNMNLVGENLLAINTGDAIEIWDWGIGEKLYTPYRGVCSTTMWVDHQVIIIKKWSNYYQIIGFW